MTEKFNPFLKENRIEGAEGPEVLVLESYTKTKEWDYNGKDMKTNAWFVKWLEVDKGFEWTEEFSFGSLIPTPDGKGFRKQNGEPGKLGVSTHAAKLYDLIEDGGFDTTKLFNDETGLPDVSALVGARFRIAYVQKKDKDGELKFREYDGKTYPDNKKFLGEFLGFANVPGNGAAVDEESINAARETVHKFITDAGGSIEQPALIRALNAAKADKQIVTLLLKKSFNEGAPWSKDGATYSI